MKATITTRKAKFTTSHRKEKAGLTACYSMVSPSPYMAGEVVSVVEVRIYHPKSTAYACLWTHTPMLHTSGSGQAGGGGYDKQSAAAADAIRNAGFDLDEDIAGRGQAAIGEAIRAIAVALGHPEAMLFVTHP